MPPRPHLGHDAMINNPDYREKSSSSILTTPPPSSDVFSEADRPSLAVI